MQTSGRHNPQTAERELLFSPSTSSQQCHPEIAVGKNCQDTGQDKGQDSRQEKGQEKWQEKWQEKGQEKGQVKGQANRQDTNSIRSLGMPEDALYDALKSRDRRFDGRVFVGVSSTGIYCRPVCRAKLPKRENCNFFASAAEAEQAGYRPCLLCRPELAPGRAPVDARASLAERGARLIEENCGSHQSMECIAARLGYTGRHFRRVFASEFNVTPVEYLQTCRLLLAKKLLTDTNLTVAEVSRASGFGSQRRLNELFKKHYRQSPLALRKKTVGSTSVRTDDQITISVGYRPPYAFAQLLQFLGARAITGVELVQDDAYMRTVRLTDTHGNLCCGWIRVCDMPSKHQLAITLQSSLMPVLTQVLTRVRLLFDTDCDPWAIYTVLSQMNSLRDQLAAQQPDRLPAKLRDQLAAQQPDLLATRQPDQPQQDQPNQPQQDQPQLCQPGTRLPGSFDVFEMCVRAILGQQITVKAAGTLAARMAATLGTPINTQIQGLTHTFPAATDILALSPPIEDSLGPLGITGARARTIAALAQAITGSRLDLSLAAQPEEQLQALCDLPGIGPWTANYIVMRALGWPDAFLETDYGVKKSLEPLTPKEIARLAQQWRPWRSYATINLWNSLH
jgi:AraC family transcriptional regulator of adaptative response / DNA-3-methyladenine glycosylase II